MGENCESKECCKENKKECGTGCEMTDHLMGLADEAWEELFKEKIKAHYEKTAGEKMTRTAEATAEAAMAFWQSKMAKKKTIAEQTEKIKQSFSE
tara:strand:- start:342 stop:626 length:285 start_codon:yes stop_codon:yes gene_type:complete